MSDWQKFQTVTIKKHLPLEHQIYKHDLLVSLSLQLYLWHLEHCWAYKQVLYKYQWTKTPLWSKERDVVQVHLYGRQWEGWLGTNIHLEGHMDNFAQVTPIFPMLCVLERI